jgi:hypothetical protein
MKEKEEEKKEIKISDEKEKEKEENKDLEEAKIDEENPKVDDDKINNQNVLKNCDMQIINENSINILSENQNRCIPLELYQKVLNDKKQLLKKVNNFTLNIKQKENEILALQIKLKKYEQDKMNETNILLNQEKYVNQLNKKIEKLESIIVKYKREMLNKESEILESKEKFDEFKNNLEHSKNIFKLEYKKQLDKKNEKINLLNREIEIKNNKIEKFEKKYTFLQEKYLKALNEKNKMDQESVYQNKKKALKSPLFNRQIKYSQSRDDFFRLITSNSNMANQIDTIKSKYKDRYKSNFFSFDNEDLESGDSQDNENINILPDINLTRSKNFEKKEDSKDKKSKKKIVLKSTISGIDNQDEI